MHILPRSIRVVVSLRQERRWASEVVHLLLRFFVGRRHANCKLLYSHVAERYAQNELKPLNSRRVGMSVLLTSRGKIIVRSLVLGHVGVLRPGRFS
jgi:hypothetical protein